ncbi:exopolysaccharide biosynthesis protein VpsF [Hymenobacter glaciei]|uniref:Exopolysaccharide biosynthesis protein VpsF n=1 Tax=Hymenobacter glaciei TaxID=877209 RepID=A0ABP7TPJ7_9BACT
MGPYALPNPGAGAGIISMRGLQKTLLFLLIIVCFMGMEMLEKFGYVMGVNATNTFTKLHPLAYLVTLLVVANVLQFDYSIFRNLFLSKPARYYFLVLLTLLIYLVLTNTASNVAYIYDSLLLPILVVSYIRSLPSDIAAKAPHYALVLILVNSLMAIVERLFSQNFFPFEEGLFHDIFRSSALLGHPLNNALITFVFVIFVLLIDLPTLRKWVYLLILLTALICFGARGSLYVAVVAVVVLYIYPLFTSSKPYFVQSSKLAVVVILIVSVLMMAYLILFTSFGERLIDASFYDDDSAGARLEAFKLLEFSKPFSYMWARPQPRIDYLQDIYDVKIIENFIIVWLLKYGLVFTSLLTIGLFFFLSLSSGVRNWFYAFAMVGLFLLAAATNNSLAVSTTALSLFAIIFSVPSDRYRFVL